MTVSETFAKNLKRLRDGARMSQEELALSSGITQNFISMLENGQKSPSLETVNNLAVALKIPAELFFKDETSETVKAS